MSTTFSISVSNSGTFEVPADSLDTFDALAVGNGKYHVLKNNIPYSAQVKGKDFLAKTYTVTINNNSYEVHIADALDVLIKNMGFEVGVAKQVNEIKAPIPGLILEIAVTQGQQVTQGDTLLILEAMKMENTFQSPRTGVIKSIAVIKGQAVNKGQLLIEFE